MEFEISDRPDHLVVDEDDSTPIKDGIGLSLSPVFPSEDHPDDDDRALHIPEQED